MPGVVVLEGNKFEFYQKTEIEIEVLNQQFKYQLEEISGVALMVICDDANFTSTSIQNFVWVTFTRSNPSHDIYGVDSFIENKHWGCRGPLIIDARIKPHHAPPVEKENDTENKIDRLFMKGGSLFGIVK